MLLSHFFNVFFARLLFTCKICPARKWGKKPKKNGKMEKRARPIFHFSVCFGHFPHFSSGANSPHFSHFWRSARFPLCTPHDCKAKPHPCPTNVSILAILICPRMGSPIFRTHSTTTQGTGICNLLREVAPRASSE